MEKTETINVEKQAMKDVDSVINGFMENSADIKGEIQKSNFDNYTKLIKLSHTKNLESVFNSMGDMQKNIVEKLSTDVLSKKDYYVLNKDMTRFLQKLAEYKNSSKTIGEDFKSKGIELGGTQDIIDKLTNIMMTMSENLTNRLLQNGITLEDQNDLNFVKNLGLPGISQIKLGQTVYLKDNTVVVGEPNTSNNEIDVFQFLTENKGKLVEGEIK